MSRKRGANRSPATVLASVAGWIRVHPAQSIVLAISAAGLWASVLLVQPLWSAPVFGFPNGDQFGVFTPDNYDPEAVITVCDFGGDIRGAITLTPSSNYIEVLLPANATDVHLNSKASALFLDCSVQDIPSMYMALPDPHLPAGVRLIPELKGAHYSNENPASGAAVENPFATPISARWWALSPSATRQRLSIYFRWTNVVQESNFTDRNMWVQVSTVHGLGNVEGQDPNTWTQVPMYVLWLLDSNSSVVQAPIDSSVTVLHGFPFVATQVSSSSLLRLAWRDTSLADSRDVRLFIGGVAIGVFGGLLTTVIYAFAAGIDWRLGQRRHR